VRYIYEGLFAINRNGPIHSLRPRLSLLHYSQAFQASQQIQAHFRCQFTSSAERRFLLSEVATLFLCAVVGLLNNGVMTPVEASAQNALHEALLQL